jgi:hypothetical protein
MMAGFRAGEEACRNFNGDKSSLLEKETEEEEEALYALLTLALIVTENETA